MKMWGTKGPTKEVQKKGYARSAAQDGRRRTDEPFRPRAATAAPVRAALPTSVLCEPTSTPSTTYLVVAQIVVCEFSVCVNTVCVCCVCVVCVLLDWVTLRVGVAY